MRITNLFLFAILFMGIAEMSFGQKETKADTSQIRYYIDKSDEYLFLKPETASFYIDTLASLSRAIDYQYGIYKSHNSRAIVYYLRGEFTESIAEYQQAFRYADQDKPYQTIRLYSNIALSLQGMNLGDSALYYTHLVLEKSKEFGLQEHYQRSLLDLANIYRNKEDYIKAAEYFSLVEEYCKTSLDTIYVIKAYSNLAMFNQAIENPSQALEYFHLAIALDHTYEGLNFLATNYGNLGLLYQNQFHKYDSAIYFYRKSMAVAMDYELDSKNLIAHVNIGNSHLDRGNNDSAYYYYKKELKNPLLDSDPTIKAAIYTNIGMYYLRNTEYKQAEKFLKGGLELSLEYQLLSFQKKAYKSLSELFQEIGNADQALVNYIAYHQISDSLKKMEVQKYASIMDYEKYLAKEKYNNDLLLHLNEGQKEQITHQRLIIIAVLLGIILLMIIFIIALRSRKKEKLLNESLLQTNESLEIANHQLHHQKVEMKELLMSKDRFVSVLGHDLKNPFTGLLGMLDLMLEDWESISDQEKKEGILALNESSQQTYEFLQSLLDWGKTQQGLIKAKNTKFVLWELVEEILVLYQLQYTQKELNIQVDIPQEKMIASDRKLLAQILQNLFSNAIKYSHQGGEILFQYKELNDRIHICIQDHGIGIPQDKIDEIFDINGQFNRLGTSGEASTGMGLILCKEYAKLIQAEFTVRSEHKKGSEFCIML